MRLLATGLLTWFMFVSSITVIAADAAGPEVQIPGTETRTLYSEIVGQEYRLQISLPPGYRDSGQRSPLVYLLDAQWDFPLVHAIIGEQYYDGFVPGLILVGLTWGGENPNPDVLRRRDFTPTEEAGAGDSGGGNNFLSFFEQELIPYIDKHYRTSQNRTLMGSSLGGLFTLYALFTRPDLFDNFIATSPATPWDNGVIYSFEKGFSTRSAQHPSRLFIAASELEELYQPVMKLVDTLRSRDYPGLSWTSHVVTGSGHSGVKPDGNTRGLQFAFKRPDLALTGEDLKPYLGTYQSKGGAAEVRVSIQDGKLLVYSPFDGQSWIMKAQNKTHFYHEGAFLNVRMLLDDSGQVTGCVVQTFGNSEAFRKSVH